ncbi:MAG: hypothetical protein HY683_05830 [Chloroflexi bacterium]|nr:hypothetical protein [Chloroflexota bacterium]
MPIVYPIDHKLRSAYLKVQRANIHLNGLKRRIRVFTEKNPSAVTVDQQQFQAGQQPILGQRIAAPDAWGAILGDACGDLRDSLDHIAWQLARLKHKRGTLTERDERKIAFPICTSPDLFNAHGAVKYFLTDALDAIEKFQPYHRPERPELELLEVLDRFANFDKHRVVPITTRAGKGGAGPGQGVALQAPSEGHVLVVTVQWTPTKPDNFKPQVTESVVFYIGNPIDGIVFHPIEYFTAIHDFIRDNVFPVFDGILQKPKGIQ